MTETAAFKLTSGSYLSTLISLWLPRHGWKVAVPFAAVAAAGIIIPDERLILVALMLLFIVIPMGMSFLYTYYMLTPEARRAVLRKRVTIDPGRSLTLHYEEDEEAREAREAREGREAKEVKEVKEAKEVIDWGMIRRVRFTSSACVYILATDRLQFIAVPYEVIPKGAVMA